MEEVSMLMGTRDLVVLVVVLTVEAYQEVQHRQAIQIQEAEVVEVPIVLVLEVLVARVLW